MRSVIAQPVNFEYQRGLPPQATYLFKHALVVDAAYQSLLKSTRQQYHQQITQVLEERFPETAETQPELLAQHYTEAGLFEQAVHYWHKAGQKAIQRSANVEAIAHLTRGLALLKTFPDSPQRAQQELTLHIALGPSLVATNGFAAPEVEQTYTRAQELCQQVGVTPDLLRVLGPLRNIYLVRAELGAARELSEQMLRIAQDLQNPPFLLHAHNAFGQTLLHLGEFLTARTRLEQGITVCASLHRQPQITQKLRRLG